MIIVKSLEELSNNPFTSPFALVPTMGNLHEGHINLLEIAREKNFLPVVSIFVNPLQFGPNEDLDKYPRTLDNDLEILEKNNCHGVFIPQENEILKNIEPLEAPFADKLCAKSRPGHFDGVITIVNKLFEVTNPQACVFGMKDFQQQLIIQHLIKTKQYEIQFLSAPVVRDTNGLALSSRNNYLTSKERTEASKVFTFLSEIQEEIKLSFKKQKKTLPIDLDTIKDNYVQIIENKGFKIDYLEILDSKTLEICQNNSTKILIAIAVFYKQVRLIDNLVVDLSSFS
ncbi:MAG: pantoate--beta-alanine ligase [Pseudomonadota bacterium]|nr:pantoate--beta-alanine ligase [Pseudomonadota bacterium]MEC8378540.1 pantoate--beta-alanine ligase [Pseudomonadota bacterium]